MVENFPTTLDIDFQLEVVGWYVLALEESFNEPKEVVHLTFKVDKATLQVVHHLHLDDATMPSFQKRILGMLSLLKIDGKNIQRKDIKLKTTLSVR